MIFRSKAMLMLLCWSAFVVAGNAADSETVEQLKFFETNVRPLLAQHCLECHGAESQKGMLRLDSRAFIMKGGESEEPAVVPGKPDESLLISAVRYESYEMPPKGRLSDDDIAILVKWIELGSPWPGGDDSIIVRRDSDRLTAEDRKWWAVQPVVDPKVPDTADGWARNEIDRFIGRKLEGAGLEPAREADRHELVRRVL